MEEAGNTGLSLRGSHNMAVLVSEVSRLISSTLQIASGVHKAGISRT
jgi:hypothetical protein